ncbi:LuxR C-terminal-related transcriptional regulator [Variovorax sp. GT1P44]|uniref:LuxR C-terminal-related transcriptional regulator n=1 Tax=Variovorax sp. GT1P44 TaxID=3443742 RepID=UPI003F454462
MNIYVIDDHPMMRDAISMVLRRLRSGSTIVELDRVSRLALEVASGQPPDMVCLDLNLPDASGTEGVRLVRGQFPHVPLAVYSASPAADYEEACIEAGADIYIEKATGSVELAAALRGLLSADLTSEPTAPVEVDAGDAGTKLSKRQVQLIAALEQGLSNREISKLLELSEHTVKVHLWRLFRKLGVKSRTQALHFARQHGLISS